MRKLKKLFYLLVSSTLLLGCKPTPESQNSNTKKIFNLEYVDQNDSDIKELRRENFNRFAAQKNDKMKSVRCSRI